MSFLSNPQALITDLFPPVPYGFDVPASGTGNTPLADIITVLAKRIAQFQSDVLMFKSQGNVTTATGVFLDLHGAEHGVPRITTPYEADAHYRPRIIAGIQKLTIPAIQAQVVNYYMSTRPANAQPIVDVYDLQSNPVKAAAANIEMFDFVIDIDFPILSSNAFFFDRSYLDTTDFLMDFGTVNTNPPDSALVAIVNSVKAANTYPIWIQRSHFVASYS